MNSGGALAGVRVLDLSTNRCGAQVTQVLCDFGAEVVMIEPLGGARLRQDRAWPFWARGKQSIQLDLKDSEDLAVAQRLARHSDIVVETFRPGVADRLGLGYGHLAADNPRLIYASITGFGPQGPCRDLQGYEGVVAAKLGVFWSLEGLARRAGPAFCTAAYASYAASQLAAQGVLAALHERETSGRGQKVETSLAQALTVYDTAHWFMRVLAQRYADGFTTAPRVVDGVPSGGLAFRLLVAMTRDGHWLQFSQTAPRLFKAMMKMFGLDWMFEDPKWSSAPDFEDVAQRVAFWELLLNVVKSKTLDEWMVEFDRDPNVWGELFRAPPEALDHPQTPANGMSSFYRDRDVGEARSPSAIARYHEHPADTERPAPRLGEFDAAIRMRARDQSSPKPAAARVDAETTAPPLADVLVVELGTYYAAPYAATLLAELGARVIKLEDPAGDPNRNLVPFPEIAGIKVLQGKESVAVDLSTADGRDIAHRVIANADIVLQSFRAGVATRLGLDAKSLQSINPDLIYQTAPGYGESGPCAHRPAFAPTISAAAGLAIRNARDVASGAELTLDEIKAESLRLSTAALGVGNPDGIAAVTAATSMMVGLHARDRHGGAQHLLTTMLSSTAHAIAEAVVETSDGARPPLADADLFGFNALYRLYRTADEWVFFAAPSDNEWRRFTNSAPEASSLAADPRFSDAVKRRENDEQLAELLASIFLRRSGAEWEAMLRSADVACVVASRGPVEAHYLDAGSVGQQSGFVTSGYHPMLDAVPRLKPLVVFSRSATRAGDAPLVGQHTAKVLSEFGYSDAEMTRLEESGVIVLG